MKYSVESDGSLERPRGLGKTLFLELTLLIFRVQLRLPGLTRPYVGLPESVAALRNGAFPIGK
jgi:hypothetical protein